MRRRIRVAATRPRQRFGEQVETLDRAQRIELGRSGVDHRQHLAVTGDEEFRYSFLNDGNANAAGAYEVPSALGSLRNGLPPGRMLRREFRALVSLRDYNY